MKKFTRLIVQYYNTDINKLALMCVFFVFVFLLFFFVKRPKMCVHDQMAKVCI